MSADVATAAAESVISPPVAAPAPAPTAKDDGFQWTAGTVCLSLALFVLAGIAEVRWMLFYRLSPALYWY